LGVCRGCGACMQPRNGEGGAYAYIKSMSAVRLAALSM
jgi:hypothetical protein